MQEKQQFDIGTYFTIKYYADKHSKTITRRAKFTDKCEFGNHKVHGFPYFYTLMLTQMVLDVRLIHGK